jgi:hypothetical protein
MGMKVSDHPLVIGLKIPKFSHDPPFSGTYKVDPPPTPLPLLIFDKSLK